MPAMPQERDPGLARPVLAEELEPTGAWASLVPGITFGEFFTRGIVAGLGAGLVFILIEMAWLDGLGKPAVAPLLVIATIFNGTDAPTTIPAQVPVDAMVGFVVHLNLAMALGLGFLPIVALIARLRLGQPQSKEQQCAAAAQFGVAFAARRDLSRHRAHRPGRSASSESQTSNRRCLGLWSAVSTSAFAPQPVIITASNWLARRGVMVSGYDYSAQARWRADNGIHVGVGGLIVRAPRIVDRRVCADRRGPGSIACLALIPRRTASRSWCQPDGVVSKRVDPG
jgi:hypothetical protein